jgi:biopolymer transport protein ExbD
MKQPLIEPMRSVARINVTPIIDVALTLVIILLITAPMIAQSDMDVALPHAQTHSLESNVRLNVTLARSGKVDVDDHEASPGGITAAIAAALARHGDDTLVVVRADETTPYDAVEALIKEARAAGAKHLAIATRQKGRDM